MIVQSIDFSQILFILQFSLMIVIFCFSLLAIILLPNIDIPRASMHRVSIMFIRNFFLLNTIYMVCTAYFNSKKCYF
jgi:hypothetical protein